MPNLPRYSFLRLALLSNAAFSLVSGVLLLLVPTTMAGLLGYDQLGILRTVGLLLMIFAGLVALSGLRERIRPIEVMLISGADFGWVVGSLGLLTFLPESFSLLGARLFGGVAAIVGAFGVAQLTTLRRFLTSTTPALGKYRYCVAIDVNADAASMWRIVSNLAEIARYLPSLASSRLRVDNTNSPENATPDSGVDVGRVRECVSIRQQQWAEEVTQFDPAGRAFQVKFLTDEPGFPFPMSSMHGGWQVLALARGKSRVTVWWAITPKLPFLGLATLALLAASVDRDFPRIIARMARDAKGRRQPEKLVAKLANTYC